MLDMICDIRNHFAGGGGLEIKFSWQSTFLACNKPSGQSPGPHIISIMVHDCHPLLQSLVDFFHGPSLVPFPATFYSIPKTSFSILTLISGIWQITMSSVSWSPTTGYYHPGPIPTTGQLLTQPKSDLQEALTLFFWQTPIVKPMVSYPSAI